MNVAELRVALSPFICRVNGRRVVVRPGMLVHIDSPVYDVRPNLFGPVEVAHGPKEKRAPKPAAEKKPAADAPDAEKKATADTPAADKPAAKKKTRTARKRKSAEAPSS